MRTKNIEEELTGACQLIDGNKIQGWFYSKENMYEPIQIEIYINNKLYKEVVANKYRADIKEKNMHPTGNVGFICDLEEISVHDDIFLKFKSTENIYFVQKGFKVGATSIQKRKKCILHIGMHKTGSSSIQHSLSRRKFENFSYFDIGSENHSIPIYSLFFEKPQEYHIHRRAGRSTDEVLQYNENVKILFEKHLLNNPESELFIISGEDISVLPQKSIEKLKAFLCHYFESVEVVAYVRSPKSFISSNFQEHIKAGLSVFNVEIHYPNYRNRFEKFDVVFGKENVRLIHFNPKELFANDVTNDFLYRLGLVKEAILFESTNESLSLEATSLIYLFNKTVASDISIPEREKIRTKLIETVRDIGSCKFSLCSSIISDIINKNFSDVKWIENRMQKDMLRELNVEGKVVCSEEDILDVAQEILAKLQVSMLKNLNQIYDFEYALKLI